MFFLGALACALAPTLNVMVAARFTLGLAVGGASVVVPAYLAEMAPSSIRGRIITRNELMIVTGQFLAFTTNATLGNLFSDLDGVWRWMLALATLPAVALWLGMLYMPESPRWLATKGRFSALRCSRPASVRIWVPKYMIELTPVSCDVTAIPMPISQTFFVFVGAGLLSLTFVAVWVPETRGSTLEEIEQRLYG